MQIILKKSFASSFALLLSGFLQFCYAQAPVLLKDINNSIVGSNPQGMTNVNGTVFFSVVDGVHGRELWKSGGTEATTVLIKDINPNGDANPSQFCNVNGIVYFTANDGNGIALWKTDGTAAGTVFVKDVFGPSANDEISQLTSCNGKLFFSALAQTNLPGGVVVCPKLYVSDGTALGTKTLGANVFTPKNLTAVGSTLFFSAAGVALNSNIELYKSNGSEVGTVLVKDINPGIASSQPGNLLNVNGTLYFSANNGVNRQIWKSNGSVAGTTAMTNTNFGFNVSEIAHVNGTVFFSGVIASPIQLSTGDDLFRLNALNNVTQFFSAGTQSLTPFGNMLVFVSGGQLGTTLSRVGVQGNGIIAIQLYSLDGFPSSLRVAGTNLFFVAGNAATGRELWKSDGNSATLVQDFVVGPTDATITDLCARSSDVLFASNGLGGNELRRSNGTLNAIETVRNIGRADSNPTEFVKMGNTTYFAADDGSTGRELWKTNNTEVGTQRVADILAGINGSNPTNLTVVTASNGNQTLFFVAKSANNGRELFKLENTPGAVVTRISDIIVGAGDAGIGNLTSVNGVLHFTAASMLAGFNNIYKTNDARTAVAQVGGSFQSANNLRAIGSNLFFTQTPSIGGPQLSKLQNDAVSTVKTFALIPGGEYPIPQQLTVVGTRLFFSAADATRGRELWVTNALGTNASPISDIVAGPTGSIINNLVNFNGVLHFAANNPGVATGLRIWKVNAALTGVETTGGLQLAAGNLTVAGNKLYFTQATQFGASLHTLENGVTSAALASFSIQDMPQQLTAAGSKVYFTAADADRGRELWKSDGTVPGTGNIADIRAGVGHSNIKEMRMSGQDLFLSANNLTNGQEPWILTNAAAVQGDEGDEREAEAAPMESKQVVEVNIYPNPASDYVNVDLSSNEHGGTVYIIAPSGQLLRNMNISEGESSIQVDVHDMPKGLYLLRWAPKEGDVITKQIVLQ